MMYNRRVSKCHPRVEACGTVDELNAAIGAARAGAVEPFVRDSLAAIQQELVLLMGELATTAEDLPRYVKDGHTLVTAGMADRLEGLVREIEGGEVSASGWVSPGANPVSAALDVARTVCRRAERRACALQEDEQLRNADILVYLNRLSDLLWLLARWVETKQG